MLKTLRSFDYHRELIETVLRLKAGPIGANLLSPLFIFFILKDFVPNYMLYIWFFAQMIVYVFRQFIAQKALKILYIADKNRVNKLLKYYLFAIFANAFLLGISSIFAILYAQELQLFILVALIFALATGAISTLTPVYHAVFIFITVIVSIFIFSAFVLGASSTYYLVGLFLAFYLILSLPSGYKVYSTLNNSIQQREEIKELNQSLEEKIQIRTHELSEKSHQLEELNKTLDQRVKDESEKLRQNEQLLIQQSRQAAMGEMIGNIAHQWRQPLNALGLILQNIQFTYQMDELSDEFMDKSVTKGKLLTTSMSKTIDDFRNFFKPNKQKEDFFIAKTIKDTIELVEASYENSNIKLHTNFDESIQINGYPSEFSQVILNILSNAKDALVEHKEDNRNIYICNYEKDGDAVIEIKDNAGGIPQEIMGKIFDPYFTTKEEGKGTGIGLYMTKTIVKHNMGGKLSVFNEEGGAKFTISFALL